MQGEAGWGAVQARGPWGRVRHPGWGPWDTEDPRELAAHIRSWPLVSAVGAGIPGGIYLLHFTQDRDQRGRAHPGPGLQEQSVLGGIGSAPPTLSLLKAKPSFSALELLTCPLSRHLQMYLV